MLPPVISAKQGRCQKKKNKKHPKEPNLKGKDLRERESLLIFMSLNAEAFTRS